MSGPRLPASHRLNLAGYRLEEPLQPRFVRNINMRAVGTNFIIRLITEDDPVQTPRAERFMRENGGVWLSHLVLIETIWVLKSVFRISRDNLSNTIDSLIDNSDIILERPETVKAALILFRNSRADFSDCLILETARQQGVLPLGTFDKNLGAIEGAEDLNNGS